MLFCFSFFGTIDVKTLNLHICIVLFEVSRAIIFLKYFLYYVVIML